MPDTTIRDGFECCQDGGYRTSRCPYCRYTMERPPCVVVTGRTAQDVTRLLREPTDEDIVLAARVIREILRDRPITHPMAERVARAVLTAYRSPEEADRA